MRRKIETFWSGTGYSCFWTPEYGIQYYHPCRDMEPLHELYGGENYYTSRSGLSGAGYLLPDPGDIIVEFGFYRTDTGPGPGHQEKRQVGSFLRGAPCYERETAPIWGYLPVANGGQPGYFPAVLTDGERICFVDPHYSDPLPEAIQNWDSLPWGEAKEIPFAYHDAQDGFYKKRKTFLLLNPDGFRGVNALRFADIRLAQKAAKADGEIINYRWMQDLSCCADTERIYVLDPLFGHITGVFLCSGQGWPSQINGWAIDNETPGQLFCYRQRGFEVTAMVVNLENNRNAKETFLAVGFDPKKVQKQLLEKLFTELQEIEDMLC